MPSSETLPQPESDAVPDDDFRIAVGVHVGVVVAALTAAVAVLAGVGGATLYMLVLAVLAGGAVAGGLLVRNWRGGPERLGRSWRRWAVLLPSAGFLGVAAVGAVFGPSALALVGGFGAVLSVFSGGLVAMMAHTRYVAAVCTPETRRASWRVETAPTPRRRRLAAALGAFCLVPVALVADFLFDVEAWWLFNLATLGGVFLGTAVRSATMHATPFGLEIDTPGNRRLLPWRRLSGYRLTGEELRIERNFWFDYRCDRAEIDDIEAVTDALSEVLADA
jgi:hypothetical protein